MANIIIILSILMVIFFAVEFKKIGHRGITEFESMKLNRLK
jgi:hypothetical protein